jgi:hypothetical protein
MGDEPIVHGCELLGLLSRSPSRLIMVHYSRSALTPAPRDGERFDLVSAPDGVSIELIQVNR